MIGARTPNIAKYYLSLRNIALLTYRQGFGIQPVVALFQTSSMDFAEPLTTTKRNEKDVLLSVEHLIR